MKRAIFAVAALVLAAPALSPAHGAPPEPKVTFNADGSYRLSDAFNDEMYCAADTAGYLTLDLLAEGIVEDIDAEGTQKAFKELQDAGVTCAKKFGWTDNQRNFAEILAQNEAIDRYAEDMFVSDKLSGEDVENLWGSLTLDDRIAFLTPDSLQDPARKQRVETALKAAGVPDDEDSLYYGKVAMVAISFMYYARDSWAETLKP